MPTFAAVDIGSNSVRLKIAKVVHGRLQTLHEDREVTRLGEGVFANGALDPEAMALTIRVLSRFTQQPRIPRLGALGNWLARRSHQRTGRGPPHSFGYRL